MSRLHSLSTTRRSTPSRRGRAGLAAAALVAVVAPLATACGAGFDSAALAVKPDSGAGAVGDAKINNVWVIVDPTSGNAEVIGAITNTGSSDVGFPAVQVAGSSAQIEPAASSGSAPAAGQASVTVGTIPAGQSVSFGQPGQPQIELTGSSLTAGNLTHVTFDFGSTGNVTVTAQVQSNTGLFADYNPDAPVPASSDNSVSASDAGSPSPSSS